MKEYEHLSVETRVNSTTGAKEPENGRRKVYLSYSSADESTYGLRDAVIKRILRYVDCAVWYDEYSEPARNYLNEVEQVIIDSDAVVVVVTPKVMESYYVKNVEIPLAKKHNKTIIPVLFYINDEEKKKLEKAMGEPLMTPKWGSESFSETFCRALELYVLDIKEANDIELLFASGRYQRPEELNMNEKYLMAKGYLRGIATEKNTEEGLGWNSEVASSRANTPKAREIKGKAYTELGNYYGCNGEEVMRVQCYEKAVDFGNAEACFNLGAICYDGVGIPQNFEKARLYLERAADAGYRGAYFILGVMNENGDGMTPNYKKAVAYYQKAAELGNSGAYKNLGKMFYKGNGVKRDFEKARIYFETAAGLGHAGAYKSLAFMYYNGDGVEQSYAKAKECYEKAIACGSIDAYNNLGYMYKHGEGTATSYELARKNFLRAAELGDANAYNNLGYMYEHAEGVLQDYLKAIAYYEKSAELGNINAYNNLGYMYEHGEGVEKDSVKAREYYMKATEGGSAIAYYNLGYMFELGLGVPKNNEKAKEYFEKAAELGNPKAYTDLGCIYLKGLGVKKDYIKAKNYYIKAAKLGEASAFTSLGIMNVTGKGGFSLTKANKNFSEAAKRGDKKAKNILKIEKISLWGLLAAIALVIACVILANIL